MKALTIGLMIVTVGIGSAASATMLTLDSDISYSQIKAWSHSLQSDVECREVVDVPGTYLCLTANQEMLSSLMGRVSFYVEGSPARSLVAESDPLYQKSPQKHYGGHDIMASDMEEFYSRLEETCRSPEKICANDLETSLQNIVIKDAQAQGYKNYAIIASSVKTKDLAHVISHEMYHARFFLNSHYQALVRQFWNNKVSFEDRKAIANIIGQIYNIKTPQGETLLLNEFQAFMLEESAEQDLLGVFAKRYAEELRKSLGSLAPGVEPIF